MKSFLFLGDSWRLMNLPDAPSLSIWKVMCSNLLSPPSFLSLVSTFQRICTAPIWCNVHISSKYQNKSRAFAVSWWMKSAKQQLLLECWTRRRGEVKLFGSDDGMVMWEIHLGGTRASPPGLLYHHPKRTFLPQMQHCFRGKQHQSWSKYSWFSRCCFFLGGGAVWTMEGRGIVITPHQHTRVGMSLSDCHSCQKNMPFISRTRPWWARAATRRSAAPDGFVMNHPGRWTVASLCGDSHTVT